MRSVAAVLLMAMGCMLLYSSRERSDLQRRGVQTDAIVRAIYGDEEARENEIWLEYQDAQGKGHWMHSKMAAHPRKGAVYQVRYLPDDPEQAILAEERIHYNYISVIFGLYFLGYGLYLGYQQWMR